MRLLARVLGWLLTVGMPLLLTLTSVRIVATPWFLDLEYQRPGFPPDPYGFTQEERRLYGRLALEYLLQGEDIAYLSARTLPGGEPLFTARELRHMEDVQALTQGAFSVHGVLLALMALAALYLAWRPARRPALRRALVGGALLTLALLLGLTALVLLNWSFFFDAFHRLFFEDGTWRFYVNDTLIRLFPQQFWFDAAIAVGALVAGGAAALGLIGWRWRPAASAAPFEESAGPDVRASSRPANGQESHG